VSLLVQNERLDQLIKEISDLISELESEITILSTEKNPYKKVTIRYLDGNMIINGKIFSLVHKPLTGKLLQAFLASEDLTLTRQELIQKVYLDESRLEHTSQVSDRLLESLYQNSLKLLSRARVSFSKVFTPDFFGFDVEWFVYDAKKQIWKLYRVP